MSYSRIGFLKIIGLSIIILIPIAIIVFLKIFGENVYSVPVYYTSGISEDSTGCQKNASPHKIPVFRLAGNHGEEINEHILEKKYTVVDFYSFLEEGSNAVKTFQMSRILQEFEQKEAVQVIRICYDCENHADAKNKVSYENQSDQNIIYASGKKEFIYKLARCGFILLNFPQKASDFPVQNNTFVLVDREKRIRGYYDATDLNETDRLLVELDILLTGEL